MFKGMLPCFRVEENMDNRSSDISFTITSLIYCGPACLPQSMQFKVTYKRMSEEYSEKKN